MQIAPSHGSCGLNILALSIKGIATRLRPSMGKTERSDSPKGKLLNDEKRTLLWVDPLHACHARNLLQGPCHKNLRTDQDGISGLSEDCPLNQSSPLRGTLQRLQKIDSRNE